MKKKLITALIPLYLIVAAGAVLLALTKHWYLAALIFVLGALASYASASTLMSITDGMFAEFNDTFDDDYGAIFKVMRDIALPCCIFDSDGRILWRNGAFRQLYDGHHIRSVLPELDPSAESMAMAAHYSGRDFQIFNSHIERKKPHSRSLTFQYWLDRTEALHYSRIYEEQMPTVALIYVDNYDELIGDKQFRRNETMVEVEQRIAKFAASADGIYRRYDSTRFIVIFEACKLNELERQRFSILESMREINTGTPLSVTISIAVGAADKVAKSDEAARLAMELALGRGGDQAVVKRGMSYAFYGGKRQSSSKSSLIKTRLFSKALRQMMENSSDVYIMGHAQPDMDCLGAALGLMRCAKLAGKKSFFLLNEPNAMIQSALDSMKDLAMYRDFILPSNYAAESISDNSLLIIVDTQREKSVMAPKLINNFSKAVVIDHHRRAVDAFDSTTLSYLEPGASSVCEIITEILQYFADNPRPSSFECEALLAGIVVDTKSFSQNTGSRTFDAASYLRRNGADIRTVKLMFRDDMQSYKNRAGIVENAMIYNNNIAISVCPDDIDDMNLISAQAADELVSIRGISAAFVLSSVKGDVSISGRSLGIISVQLILEKLGGGGHLTVAGAQLKDTEIDEAIIKLEDAIDEYMSETALPR